MNRKDLEMIIKLEWPIEDYLHSLNFSLDREGLYLHKLRKDGVELKRPDYLYKYFSNNKNSLSTLEDGYLYFSHPRNFNDPFDCLTNREKHILKGGPEIAKHRENLGICCFSLVNDNPLMWGHYTNYYEGFCIKLNNQKLLNSSNIQIKTFVSYLKDYQPSYEEIDQVVEKLENAEFLKKTTKDLFHRILRLIHNYTWKYSDWNYEKEFRAISWTTDTFNRRFEIERADLEEVYIGHKMKSHAPAYYHELCRVLKQNYPTCKVYEVRPHPLIVKLEFDEID